MKIRTGFVSNSSSSSFVIMKTNLTVEQIEMIHNHIEIAMKIENFTDDAGCCINEYDAWVIEEDNDSVCGHVNMDNFDMFYFLNEVCKIKEEFIKMDGEDY